MCGKKKGCKKPRKLKGKPEECSPEQIRKCHGGRKQHPCLENPKKPTGR